jgi:hypothetical protein
MAAGSGYGGLPPLPKRRPESKRDFPMEIMLTLKVEIRLSLADILKAILIADRIKALLS